MRPLIRVVRDHCLDRVLKYRPKGQRPRLQAIVDLTMLEKCGKFKAFVPLIQVLQGKRGLPLVVYLVVGQLLSAMRLAGLARQSYTHAAQLAMRLIGTLPHVTGVSLPGSHFGGNRLWQGRVA